MEFIKPLIKAKLIKRYKRFLCDVQLSDGRLLTAHTANTGSMLGCAVPGSTVWLSDSENLERKYRHTWELVENDQGILININTHRANVLVKEAIENNVIIELADYQKIKPEVAYGQQKSRIDFLLTDPKKAHCYVEVKNVTAMLGNTTAIFPDAVSARGTKHLEELMLMVSEGKRAVLIFCVSRNDATTIQPADHIDVLYGKTLRQAISCGVEVYAYVCQINTQQLCLTHKIAVIS